MQSLARQEVFAACETLIVKIGSNVLTDLRGQLDLARVHHLSEQIARLIERGKRVVVVSSGAVSAGMGALQLTVRPNSLPELQAAASVGQVRLMDAWSDALAQADLSVGQILLTVGDFQHRRRYLNVRNTIRSLFALNAVPVVNENDSVSVEEIAFSDNDQLASMIATLVPRPLMIILSSVDGLFSRSSDGGLKNVIDVVPHPDESLLQHVSNGTSSRGTGGMKAKLQAITAATEFGESVILANGETDGILDQIAAGESVGTLFIGRGNTIPAWKKWIGYAAKSEGRLELDDGACRAISTGGRSLLAVGIKAVVGKFDQGASVELTNSDGSVVARGLVNYSSAEIQKIEGQNSERIAQLLGHVPYSEVIHRDNLVLFSSVTS